MSDDTPAPDERPFGARFLAEYRRLGGSLAPFDYAEVRAIEAADREGLIRALRSKDPIGVTYAAIQRIRAVETPELLAAELLLQRQLAAQGAMVGIGLFALLAALT